MLASHFGIPATSLRIQLPAWERQWGDGPGTVNQWVEDALCRSDLNTFISKPFKQNDIQTVHLGRGTCPLKYRNLCQGSRCLLPPPSAAAHSCNKPIHTKQLPHAKHWKKYQADALNRGLHRINNKGGGEKAPPSAGSAGFHGRRTRTTKAAVRCNSRRQTGHWASSARPSGLSPG